MSDEREPLWTNQRIRDRYHALLPSEANMGEMEYWRTLRDVGERVSYELRNDYEARITELEAQLAESREDYRVADNENGRLREFKQLLEAQLAQRWEPLPDGEHRSVADIFGTFSVFGNGAPDAYPVIRQGDNIVMLDMGDAICRLVTQEQPAIPPDVRETIREALDVDRVICERRSYETERYGGDKTLYHERLAAIDAALAYLDAA